MSEQEKNPVRAELERIEPSDGAKDRMLQNIRRKAAEQAAPAARETANHNSGKRILRWALPLAACLALAVFAAVKLLPRLEPEKPEAVGTTFAAETGEEGALAGGFTEDLQTGGVQIANPFAEYGSAAELAAAMGFEIDAPEGAEDVHYCSISGEIAEADFTYAGRQYCFRASTLQDDFSGLYGEESEPRLIDAETGAALTGITDGEAVYRRLVWTEGELTLILSNTDGASEAEMEELYRAIR